VSSTLDKIRRAAAPHGLNLVAATPIARYDATVKEVSRAASIDPQARSIVVIGNGGGELWRRSRLTQSAIPDGGIATIRSTTLLARLSSATSPLRFAHRAHDAQPSIPS